MNLQLDAIFHSLADSTRRDILLQLSLKEQSVSEISLHYNMSMAAVSKHVNVLEQASLISRRRDGKKFMLQSNPVTLRKVDEWMEFYRKFWMKSFEKLDSYLTTLQKGETEDETDNN
jgi:DNA-binding transcriptional ArsR family regulator